MAWEPVFARESRWETWGRILMILSTPVFCLSPCFFCWAVIGSFDDGESPQDTVLQTLPSPDGRLKAVVFSVVSDWYDEYGGPSTEVSILKASDSPPTSEGEGNAFGCSQGDAPLAGSSHGPIVSVTWMDSDSLRITYDDRSKVEHTKNRVRVGHHMFFRDEVSIGYATNEPVPTAKSPFAGKWSGRCSWEGKVGKISFSVAQFGDVFGLTLNDILMGRGSTILTVDDNGKDSAGKTRLEVKANRIRGTLIANDGMAYRIEVSRSGPTRWVAPPPEAQGVP